MSQLELGWPHLRIITDEKVTDPQRAADQQYLKGDPVFGATFPRAVAHRYLWAQLHPRLSPEATEATRHAEDFPAEQVPALLDRLFPSMELYGFHCEDALYLLEALFGTERAATWVVERLERLKRLTVHNPHDRLLVALECLGWLLLRAGAGVKPLRARVARLRDGQAESSCARAFLSVALDREGGWRALPQKHTRTECCFITSRMAALSRSAKVVNELVTARRLSPWNDPQCAHLAGLALYAAPPETRGWSKARKAALVEHFSVLLDEPLIAGAVVPLAAASLPKAKLRAWVEANARTLERVLPVVERGADAAAKKKAAAVRALLP